MSPSPFPQSYQLSTEHLTFAALARIERLLGEIRDQNSLLMPGVTRAVNLGGDVDALEDPTPDLNDVVAYAIVCSACGYPEEGERHSSDPEPEWCMRCRYAWTPAQVPAQ